MYTLQLADDSVPAPQAAPSPTTTSASDLVNSSAVKTASFAALTYHGYKRTGSITWALIYGLLGRTFPQVGVPIALAQGFGQKKACP